MSINKTIHYCWFGRGEKSEVIQKCIESWKKYMPDWEIIEWNEDNTDLSFCSFLKQAYESKKWAFVSDVVRLKSVYEYGGIYLDTDVEVLRNWEELLYDDAFFFFQNATTVATGLGYGAKRHNVIVKDMLDVYMDLEFDADHASDFACPKLNTDILTQKLQAFNPINSNQYVEKIRFYDASTYTKYGFHYGEASWMSEEQKAALSVARKKYKKSKLKQLLRNENIFAFLHKHKLRRIEKAYTFLVYDFTDYGIKYWLARIYYSIKNRV